MSESKNTRNMRKHKVSLKLAETMVMETAILFPDESQDYGEDRWIAIGFIGVMLYILVFTEVIEDPYTIRAISLRRAEPSEERLYAEDN